MNGLFVGLTTIDIQYFVDTFPTSNMKVKTQPAEILVGGPATNAAVAFSYLGGKATLASAVGENPISPFVKNDFDNGRVGHTDLAGGKEFAPVLATVITSANNGDRAIITHNPNNIEAGNCIQNIFEKNKYKVLLLDGFYPAEAAKAALYAKKMQLPVVIDCGSWKPQYKELLPLVDYAICSENFLPPGCGNSDETIHYMVQSGIPNVAITMGHRPIMWKTTKESGEIEVEKMQVADTLGAGDFFHGAFAYYIVKTGDFAESLTQASKLATTTCRYRGTRDWLKF